MLAKVLEWRLSLLTILALEQAARELHSAIDEPYTQITTWTFSSLESSVIAAYSADLDVLAEDHPLVLGRLRYIGEIPSRLSKLREEISTQNVRQDIGKAFLEFAQSVLEINIPELDEAAKLLARQHSYLTLLFLKLPHYNEVLADFRVNLDQVRAIQRSNLSEEAKLAALLGACRSAGVK